MNAERLAKNPFYVLEVAPTASRMEIERAGQKLLALLAIESESTKTYRTPFGPRRRDEAMVREAVAELRDPTARVRHELWFETVSDEELSARNFEWRAALRAVHWSGPCTGQ